MPSLPQYYYPGAALTAGMDGLIVQVQPEHGSEWIGTFAFGRTAPKGTSGIFTTPDSNRLCAVANGAGYFVIANNPESWEMVDATPIIDVRLIPNHGIIVFAEFTGLVAYDSNGVRWRTGRLTWDNLRLTKVTDTIIGGEFWDIRSETIESFAVDLATGTHRGGAAFG